MITSNEPDDVQLFTLIALDGHGHRQAHCHIRASPYLETGYYIALAPGTPKALMPPKAKRRRPKRKHRHGGERVDGWRS